MITRLQGIVESLDERCATVRPGSGPEVAIEVLLPAYFAAELKAKRESGGAGEVDRPVTFHTLFYLEGQGQGTSFIPRLIGFGSPRDREFFDLFTTVKGIGNRKALRALAKPPAVIAGAIARRDVRALTDLPEIGKRMAETVVAELHGKVDAFALEMRDGPSITPPVLVEPRSVWPPAVEDAIHVLCTLGETRTEAERKVQVALQRAGKSAPLDSADKLVAMVFAGR